MARGIDSQKLMVTGALAASEADEHVFESVAAAGAAVVEEDPVDDEQAASTRASAPSGATTATRNRWGRMVTL